MKIKEIIDLNVNKLIKETKIEKSEAFIIVKELLVFFLKKDKNFLLINNELEIEEENIQIFNNYVEEILEGKPLQYITNKAYFLDNEFFVDENVLIPQPDTEIVVLKGYELVNGKEEVDILDLCTGSGAISISLYNLLKKDIEGKNINIIGTDISKKVLKIAEKNNNIMGSKVSFIKSDLFKNIKEKYDLIISNPPYIKSMDIKNLSKEVQNEPRLALDGGEDGLTFYRKILIEAYKYLKEEGFLVLEIGFDQKEDILRLEKENLEFIEGIKDLSNNDRCLIFKRK